MIRCFEIFKLFLQKNYNSYELGKNKIMRYLLYKLSKSCQDVLIILERFTEEKYRILLTVIPVLLFLCIGVIFGLYAAIIWYCIGVVSSLLGIKLCSKIEGDDYSLQELFRDIILLDVFSVFTWGVLLSVLMFILAMATYRDKEDEKEAASKAYRRMKVIQRLGINF
jgi:hypothetical protein